MYAIEIIEHRNRDFLHRLHDYPDMNARLDIELPVDVSYMIDDNLTAKVSHRAVHSLDTAGVETQQLALFNAVPQPHH